MPDPLIFPPMDWTSHSMDIFVGIAAQSSPLLIFISFLLFFIRKHVLESSHLEDFCYNKIDCGIYYVDAHSYSLIMVENDKVKPQCMKILLASTWKGNTIIWI